MKKDRECLECKHFFNCQGKDMFATHSMTRNVHSCLKFEEGDYGKETKNGKS